jgi:hypothetical protein
MDYMHLQASWLFFVCTDGCWTAISLKSNINMELHLMLGYYVRVLFSLTGSADCCVYG